MAHKTNKSNSKRLLIWSESQNLKIYTTYKINKLIFFESNLIDIQLSAMNKTQVFLIDLKINITNLIFQLVSVITKKQKIFIVNILPLAKKLDDP